MSTIRVCYQTIEFGKEDIHLRTLRDIQQYSDTNGVAEKLGISSANWPIFGVVWPSSIVLAKFMFNFQLTNKRILEVGCGIGLASLIMNRLHADITATDYHPETEQFLQENTYLNKDREIPFLRTGWADNKSSLGEFDLIVGSDLLYEDEHIELLAGFINQHAKPHAEIIVVDPGRGRHAKFSKKMVLLGFSHSQSKPAKEDCLETQFKGVVLRYCR